MVLYITAYKGLWYVDASVYALPLLYITAYKGLVRGCLGVRFIPTIYKSVQRLGTWMPRCTLHPYYI